MCIRDSAYIDPENEAIIQQAVARLVEGKTVIVIAHRLSTITDANQIFVVADAVSYTHLDVYKRQDNSSSTTERERGFRDM